MMTYQARTAILARLKHSSFGINTLVAAACSENGIEEPPTFNLATGSRQLVSGSAPLDKLEAADRIAYPLINIYGVSAFNQRRSRPAEFAGTLVVAIDCWLGDYRIDQLELLENHTDAVEHALVAGFNTLGSGMWQPAAAIGYDAEMAIQRNAVVMVEAMEVWRRMIRTQLTFLARQP